MQRRDFLMGAAGGAAACLTTAGAVAQPQPASALAIPPQLAGMSLPQLCQDYRRRLFDEYLPFWDKGGCDRQYGGFLCELNDDGTPASSEKFIWYQGRGIWVYAFLYNELAKERRWLDLARAGRDFMVRHMHAGGGRWYEKVDRDGRLIEGVGTTVYGWLFAAAGLVEYYLATGERRDLDLARQSIDAAVTAYDSPGYFDAHTTLYTPVDLPKQGLRSQGHSMVLVSVISRLLSRHADERLEELLGRHVDVLLNRFWNPQYRIVNEYLHHDYSRIPGADTHMFTGHSLETLWLVAAEALRRRDRALFEMLLGRIRHLLEMAYDYVFEGWGDGNYFVFEGPNHGAGPDFSVKTMWAHCEALLATMMALEHSGAVWAAEWYARLRAFSLRVMPVPGCGVWRQAVDRLGNDVKRVGVSTKRKDNFHQVRYLMMNLLSLQRLLAAKPGPEAPSAGQPSAAPPAPRQR